MVTEKQKCIAEQAIYGDLMLNRRAYDDVEEKYIIEQVDSKWVLDFINWDKLLSLTPILRPMSDLTKEITHKGYNDDKPFIPLVELTKIAYLEIGDYSIYTNHTSEEISANPKSNGTYGLLGFHFSNNTFEILSYGEVIKRSKKDEDPFVEIIHTSLNQQTYYDILNQLHFDTRNLIATNEAIDVNSLPNNPYAV